MEVEQIARELNNINFSLNLILARLYDLNVDVPDEVSNSVCELCNFVSNELTEAII